MAVKLKVKSGDPKKEGGLTEKVILSANKTPLDDTADLRDALSGIAGSGFVDLKDPKAIDGYTKLQKILGPSQAQKLMTHAFIFNQKPELAGMAPEARVKAFYESPSGDADVTNVLGRVKSFGYGVLPGFRTSSNETNQQLAQRGGSVAVVDPNVQKIKLKIGSKVQ